MNAASKLAAMAKVLETPVKSKPAKNFSSQSKSGEFSRLSVRPAELSQMVALLFSQGETNKQTKSNRCYSQAAALSYTVSVRMNFLILFTSVKIKCQM